jgi:hypothetical protein
MVVSRPGGASWQARFADRPHVGPSRVSKQSHCRRHRAPGTRLEGSRESSRARPCSRCHPPAMRIAGHLATAFIPQLAAMVSRSWRRSGGEMLLKIAFVLLIAWLLGVIAAVQNRRSRARAPPGRIDALVTGGAQGSRRCRRSWNGCRLRQIMTTRSNSVSFRRSVPR